MVLFSYLECPSAQSIAWNLAVLYGEDRIGRGLGEHQYQVPLVGSQPCSLYFRGCLLAAEVSS